MALTLVAFGLGCASTEKARLLSESGSGQLIEACESAVIGTVISSEGFMPRYIENYVLLGSPPRAKVYANVVFRVEDILKGESQPSELRLKKLLANGETYLFMIGEQYLLDLMARQAIREK